MSTVPPVAVVSVPVEASVAVPKPRPPFLFVGIGVGILVLAAGIAGAWYLYSQNNFFGNLPKGAEIDVVQGIVPAGEVFALEESDTLARVESPLAGTQVMDKVEDEAITYYLLGDPTTLTSDIYRESEGAVTKVTNSATLKFDLTFDPVSKSFAYLSGKVASTTLTTFATTKWNLTVFSEANGERALEGTGRAPMLLPGGHQLLVGDAGNIAIVDTSTGQRRVLLTAASAAPFAVTSDGKTLALFNRTTGALDYFTLAGMSASYERSVKVTGLPTALAFAGAKKLIMVTSTEDRSAQYFSVVGGKTLEVPNPVIGLLPQKIIISYE